MTREEEIKKASGELFNSAPCSKTYKMGFEAGVMWADANPKSPWISVEDDLPCNHKEFTEGKRWTKPVLAVLAWNENPSERHIEICDMYAVNINWYWRIGIGNHHHVVYWMPLPKMSD